MKQDYEAVGFLAQGAVEEHWAAGRIILQKEGGEIYGYLVHGPIRPAHPVNVVQTLVDMDARRLKAGEAMFYELVNRGVTGLALRIRLRCAEDLPSNFFWQAMGFRKVNTVYPDNKRRRGLNVYEFNLFDDFLAPSDMDKLVNLSKSDLIVVGE
jgi:hypothetical protein